MKKRKILVNLFLGSFAIVGILMILYSLDKTITGAVVGVNSNSQAIGLIGVLLMLIVIMLQRHESKNNK